MIFLSHNIIHYALYHFVKGVLPYYFTINKMLAIVLCINIKII